MITDESNFSEDELIKHELFSDKSITKPESKEPSLTDSVRELIKKKLDDGFQITDKNSRILLQKTIIDELKLIGGWRGKVKKYIGEILTERKISLAGLGIDSDKVGDMTINLIKSETTPEIKPEPETIQKSKGALPIGWDAQKVPITETEKQEQIQTQEPESKPMSQVAQERLIKSALNDMVAPLYISLGIIEPDEDEKEDESKLPTAKAFRKNMDGLATQLNEYLIENNIQLPSFFNHISIMLSIGMVLVMPVVKWKFFSSKQTPNPKYNESVDLSSVTA